MNIKVYQINRSRDRNEMYMREYRPEMDIDSSIYDFVFEGSIKADNFENLFRLINSAKRPASYHGTGLFKSDVVGVVSGSGIEPGFYYCDTFDFRKIEFDPSRTERKE